jgi:hypothetical protein
MTAASNRRNMRYKPERLEFALVMYDGNKAGWHPDDAALIIDESAVAGCQLVMKYTQLCKPGSRVRVKLGHLDPLVGEVVWRREIDADLFRVGIRFLE